MTKILKQIILGIVVSGVSIMAISGFFVYQSKVELKNTAASQSDNLHGECGPYECGDPPSRIPYGGLPIPG